jgi:hypothetical protein
MTMSTPRHGFSRRGFCFCFLAATASVDGWLTPSQALAEANGVVEMIKSEASRATIHMHCLRGKVAVLEGSGGNVAVL